MNELLDTFYVDEKGKTNKATESILETGKEVSFLCCGDVVHRKIMPIEEACAKCTMSYHIRLGGKDKCRKFQKREGERRGFKDLVCPQQFIEK